jgi:hypothetical protein
MYIYIKVYRYIVFRPAILKGRPSRFRRHARMHTHAHAGKLELVTVEFDLRTVLEDALDSVAGRAMMKVRPSGQYAIYCINLF